MCTVCSDMLLGKTAFHMVDCRRNLLTLESFWHVNSSVTWTGISKDWLYLLHIVGYIASDKWLVCRFIMVWRWNMCLDLRVRRRMGKYMFSPLWIIIVHSPLVGVWSSLSGIYKSLCALRFWLFFSWTHILQRYDTMQRSFIACASWNLVMPSICRRMSWILRKIKLLFAYRSVNSFIISHCKHLVHFMYKAINLFAILLNRSNSVLFG